MIGEGQRTRGGSVLIMCIWVLVFLAILNAALYKMASSQMSVVKSLRQRTLCLYLAKAAYNYAKIERSGDLSDYDTLYELRKKQEKELGRGKFNYTFIDEESKININKAPDEVLARLPGLDTQKVTAINQSELKPFDLKEKLLLVGEIDEETFGECKDFITVYGSSIKLQW